MNYSLVAELIEELVALIPSPPARNCSCHLSPPCSDCIEHAWDRDLMARAEQTRKELLALYLINGS